MLFANTSSISFPSNVIPLPARKKRETRPLGTWAEAELARRGSLRPVLLPGGHETGFLPTDLELCLLHKTPFLGRDAGTGESGFDRLN